MKKTFPCADLPTCSIYGRKRFLSRAKGGKESECYEDSQYCIVHTINRISQAKPQSFDIVKSPQSELRIRCKSWPRIVFCTYPVRTRCPRCSKPPLQLLALGALAVSVEPRPIPSPIFHLFLPSHRLVLSHIPIHGGIRKALVSISTFYVKPTITSTPFPKHTGHLLLTIGRVCTELQGEKIPPRRSPVDLPV